MDVLRIDHDTGVMRLYVRAFFPCTRQKANIVFPLVAIWCSEEQKRELREELTKIADEYESLCRKYQERHDRSGYAGASVKYRRAKMNLECLRKHAEKEITRWNGKN